MTDGFSPTAPAQPSPQHETLMSGRVIEYAPSVLRIRDASGFLDWCYFALAVCCYFLAGYAQRIMPGGTSWGDDWIYATFLMNVAAFSSIVICCAGVVRIFFMGRKRCPVAVLAGVWSSGLLPVLMFFFAKRWLQMNLT